ncbi:MAG: signal recognition particle-docking protein FtsY [Acidimicrobiales bacterium]
MTATDLILLVSAVLGVALLVTGVYLSSRRRGRDLELEPGPGESAGGTTTLERPDTAPPVEEAPVDTAPPVEEAPVDTAPPVEEAPVDTAPPVEEAPALDELVRPSFRERLSKARSAFTGYLGGLVGLSQVGEDEWEELEEALIRADVGVSTSMQLIEDVRQEAKSAGVDSGEQILDLLKARMHRSLEGKDRSLNLARAPELADGAVNVWLFVGVNGVGKTTTIGKVGRRLVADGHEPLMAAGDTFRAAAAEQLTTWAERAGAQIVRGNEGSDPSSVIFDGVQAAAARGCDVVLADTAGRLHNKANLMDELSKVRRVASKPPGQVTEVLLVIDATTGQNGMAQAKVFTEAVEVTGVVLTKLDGSAKGGIVFAIESELDIPVKLVGLGETAGDLVDFSPDEFVDALFA